MVRLGGQEPLSTESSFCCYLFLKRASSLLFLHLLKLLLLLIQFSLLTVSFIFLACLWHLVPVFFVCAYDNF